MTQEDRLKYEAFLVDLRTVLRQHDVEIHGEHLKLRPNRVWFAFIENDRITASTTIDELY